MWDHPPGSCLSKAICLTPPAVEDREFPGIRALGWGACPRFGVPVGLKRVGAGGPRGPPHSPARQTWRASIAQALSHFLAGRSWVCMIHPVLGRSPGIPRAGIRPLFRALPIVGLAQMRALSEGEIKCVGDEKLN